MNQEELIKIKREIGNVFRHYKNIKKISNKAIENYYKNKGIEGFTLCDSQSTKIMQGEANYAIDSLLKYADILGLEIVIQPKKK